ncbi:MAG TPA: Ig-like domain-containing protein [Thermomicrobiales bacterium]|nr:Ig-like domain-containing protein [Thermomicrobiales bacterium]
MLTKLFRGVVASILLATALASATPALAVPPGNAPFLSVWDRTDGPVAELLTPRTWMWGPDANTGLRWEPYLESGQPGRVTQMFDKSRMEITHPDAVDDGLWYVTNGLLVVELISGRMQIGDDVFLQLDPATVNVAGDSDDPNGPTYATFLGLLDAEPAGVGAPVMTRLSQDGNVQVDPALAARGIVVAVVDDVTDHSIAAPFWDFMLSSGLVRSQAGLVNEPLFINPYYATGRPIAEPYWATVKVANVYKDVLMQCFERRCLTYTPDNPPGWQVEAGNVGQHYDTWRYHSGFEYAIEWVVAALGGTVELNGVTVTIPPGALSHDTLVTIVPTRDTPDPPEGYVPVSAGHEIGLSGATLLAPAELSLPFDPASIPPSAGQDDLVAGRADDAFLWELLEAEADGGAITLGTSQLSTWQVFSPGVSEAGEHAPVAEPLSATVVPSAPTQIVLSATDSDSASLTFEIVTPPANGELDTLQPEASCAPAGSGVSCTATVIYTGDFAYAGTDSFSYRANDGQNDSAPATVNLTLEYPDSQKWNVSAESGIVIDLPGRLILMIPEGALTCDAVITISTLAPAMGNIDPPASNQHDIEMTAANRYDPNCPNGVAMQPGQTARLGLYYDSSSFPPGSSPSDLYIGRLVGVTWEHLGGSLLDGTDPIIYVETSTFSRWNVFIG